MRKIITSIILGAGILSAASNCGGIPPKCPIGYVADRDIHGNWGCYQSRT